MLDNWGSIGLYDTVLPVYGSYYKDKTVLQKGITPTSSN